jgi:hypothetical protein
VPFSLCARSPDLVVYDTYGSSAAAFESAAQLMLSLSLGAQCDGRVGSARLMVAAAVVMLLLSCCLWWIAMGVGEYMVDL